MFQRQEDDTTFWQLVTGTIETGEIPYQTALREVRKELRIDTIAQNFIGRYLCY